MRATHLLLVSLLVAGCGGELRPTDPDAELRPLVDRYLELSAEQSTAAYADDHGGPLLDRGHLRVEIERLALEFPDHPSILFAAAVTSHDAHERAKAQHFLDRLLRVEPDHADAVLLRCRIAREDGNLPLARRLLDQLLARRPALASAREALAGLHFEAGDLPAAHRELVLAERLGPPTARVAYHRGLLAEARGDHAAAQAAYRTAVARDPDTPAGERLAALQALEERP